MLHEYHQIIFDEGALAEYLLRLPGSEADRYYFVLLARPKYDDTGKVKHTGQSLKRGFATSDMLLQKIRQLEMRKDSILTKGQQLPGECLALYLMPSPRDPLKASVALMTMLAEGLGKKALSPKSPDPDPVKLARDALHTARTRASAVVTFDYDFDKTACRIETWLVDLGTIVPEATTIIETRGGIHVQVQPALVTTDSGWYQKFEALKPEQKGDLLSPVPGCCQGGFVPKVHKYPGLVLRDY